MVKRYFPFGLFAALLLAIALLANSLSVGPKVDITADGGAMYYVAPTGLSTNPCSEDAPCRQISNAISKANPGDTILVADGEYQGFRSGKSGTSDAWITIKATGSNARILPTDTSPQGDTIYIYGVGYIILDGFISTQATRAAVYIANSNHIVVRNMTLYNNTLWGIFTGSSPNLILERNKIYDHNGPVAQHGIYISNYSKNTIVRYNVVYGNARSGIQTNGAGLISESEFYGNILYDNGKQVGGTGAFNFICGKNMKVYNNLLFNNRAGGITISRGSCPSDPDNYTIYNNTVHMPLNSGWPIQVAQSVGPIKFRNNIFYSDDAVKRGGLEFQAGLTDVNNTDTNYNLFNKDASKVAIGSSLPTTTLAKWQSEYGKDKNSITASASDIWVNSTTDPATADYRLKAGSPAINAGIPLSEVTTDLTGATRPSNQNDIGAYKYGVAESNPGGNEGPGDTGTGSGDTGGSTAGGTSGDSTSPGTTPSSNTNKSTTAKRYAPLVDVSKSWVRVDGENIPANGSNVYQIVVALKDKTGKAITSPKPKTAIISGNGSIGSQILVGEEWFIKVASSTPGDVQVRISAGTLDLATKTLHFIDPSKVNTVEVKLPSYLSPPTPADVESEEPETASSSIGFWQALVIVIKGFFNKLYHGLVSVI